ncbi:MAG: peptide deformylase [Candidatus Eremiobacteraeota bacterium]|nr:peptide deformylase [Candidatus Eremiobacteraeota bacterium]
MPVLPIKMVGEAVLRRKATKLERVDAPLARLLEDMVETMYAANGIGLAGPQVGVSQRILVIDIGDGPLKVINPRIVEQHGRASGPEGCLSIPGLVGEVERHEKIVVKALDESGQNVVYEADGLLAVVFQHEIDHLDGKLFVDTAINIYDATAVPDEEEEPEE